jgi:hypothetical protein
MGDAKVLINPYFRPFEQLFTANGSLVWPAAIGSLSLMIFIQKPATLRSGFLAVQ